MARKARSVEPLVAFSWGYEGWGNHTKDLIAIVDAVEASRGYERPVFVDVRIRRQGRAVGFRERAFEQRLGSTRYTWLRGLGNRAIVEDLDDDVVISDPSQADALLEIAVAAAKERRRVIFFCSCGSPQFAADCHRAEVARLVLQAARRQTRALTIQEWPGGSPISTEIELPPVLVKRLLGRALARLPLPAEISVASAAALPHLSLVRARAGDTSVIVISGPAVKSAKGWMLPVHNVAPPNDLSRVQRVLDRDLIDMNLAPRGSDLKLPRRWRQEPMRRVR